MTAEAKVRKLPDLADIARESFEAANNDARAAVGLMSDRVRKNPSLFKALMLPLVEEACYSQIRKIFRGERAIIWRTPNASDSGNGDRVVSLARGNLHMLMQFRLPNGKPVAESKKPDLEEAASFYGKQASDMSHKSRWLNLVASELAEDLTVGEVLTEERLRILQEKANG